MNAPDTSNRLTVRPDEHGTILVVVMITAVAMFGLLLAGTVKISSYRTEAETAFRCEAQARNVARAGVIDGFSWFRRQPVQPVVDFAPLLDPGANPPVLDTEEPSVGIVREFQISGSTWARYEVRKVDPNRPEQAVRDLSALRGYAGQGQAWNLASWGLVFRKQDVARRYNEPPNQVLATAWAFTEIRRMTLSPPGEAAVCCSRGDRVVVGANSRVIGGEGTGIVFPPGTGTPAVSGELSGTTKTATLTDYNASIEHVFGVTLDELESLADEVAGGAATFPSPFPRQGLVVVKGDITFDYTTPLRGTGVVVVIGNVTVDASARNFFNGMLYVNGAVTFRAPSLLRGALIASGTVRTEGYGDVAEIEFDPGVLADLMMNMGQYRISRAIRYGPRVGERAVP
ncbi:MAG: hypothetical protein JXQ29_02295 [Planctomycetes bacterium]|nr:hypothetical protein [Planctomycetota bacterium]